MIIIAAAIAMLVGACGAAQAEPISTFIGLSALISGAFGVSAAVGGAIGGALVGGVISIGISFAAQAFMPKPEPHPQNLAGDLNFSDGSGSVNAPEIRYTTRQATAPKRVIVGSAYVGGVLFFQQAKPPYLVQGILINHGVIAGIDKIWIGTNELSIPAIVPDVILTPIPAPNQPDYRSYLQVSLGFGESTQAIDPILAAEFPNLDAEFRQRGIARAVFRFDFGISYENHIDIWGQGQSPAVYLLARGVPAYDPRDPTQDLDDETTWRWTNNATLIQAWYLTRDFGGRIAKAKIPWATKVVEAADYDDESVPCADGSFIKRHTIDGVITLNQRPVDVMSGMLTANSGYLLQSGGMIWPSSSKPRTPIATIHDGVLAGGIDYRAAKPKRDLLNKLQCRFVASEQDYQTIDGPILNRTDLQAVDGEVLSGTLSLPFTLDHRRAQRLQKSYLDKARLGSSLTCRTDISVLALCDEDPVGQSITFDSTLFSMANGTYLCVELGFADNFTTVEWSLIEYDPAIERDWVAADDEQPFMLASLDLAA